MKEEAAKFVFVCSPFSLFGGRSDMCKNLLWIELYSYSKYSFEIFNKYFYFAHHECHTTSVFIFNFVM